MAKCHYALITGGASGLGRALCLAAARRGYEVAVADVDAIGGAETVRLIAASGGRGRFVQLDVSLPDSWAAVVAELLPGWPQLDLLVNNAGVAVAGWIDDTPLDDWRWAIDVNFWGTLYGCRSCLPWLRESSAGARVLNVASVAGLIAPPGMGAYNVSKAAVVALSETLAVELYSFGIAVTVLCPGFLATNLATGGRFADPMQRQLLEQAMREATWTVAEMAEFALDASAAGKLFAVPPRRARRMWRLARWFPERFYRYLACRYGRTLPDRV